MPSSLSNVRLASPGLFTNGRTGVPEAWAKNASSAGTSRASSILTAETDCPELRGQSVSPHTQS